MEWRGGGAVGRNISPRESFRDRGNRAAFCAASGCPAAEPPRNETSNLRMPPNRKPDFTNSIASYTNIVTNIIASHTNIVTNSKMVARCARGKKGLTQVLKNAF